MIIRKVKGPHPFQKFEDKDLRDFYGNSFHHELIMALRKIGRTEMWFYLQRELTRGFGLFWWRKMFIDD